MLGMLEYIMNMLRILANEVEDEEARWSDGEILRCAQDDRREGRA